MLLKKLYKFVIDEQSVCLYSVNKSFFAECFLQFDYLAIKPNACKHWFATVPGEMDYGLRRVFFQPFKEPIDRIERYDHASRC